MTQRSEHGSYIRSLVGNLISTDRPADTAALRAATNNAAHLLDQRGQQIVAMSGHWTSYETDEGSTEWHRPWGMPDPVFPLTLTPRGYSVRIVPHLTAYVVGSGEVAYRVQLVRSRGSRFALEVGDLCAEASTSSTTPVSLAFDPIFASRTELGDLTPRSELPPHAPAPVSYWRSGLTEVLSAAEPGQISYADLCFVRLQVWMRTTSGSAVAHVTSFSAREFITGGI